MTVKRRKGLWGMWKLEGVIGILLAAQAIFPNTEETVVTILPLIRKMRDEVMNHDEETIKGS